MKSTVESRFFKNSKNWVVRQIRDKVTVYSVLLRGGKGLSVGVIGRFEKIEGSRNWDSTVNVHNVM